MEGQEGGNQMNADCKGALAQINKAYKAFVHNGKQMSKAEVKAVLEYAIKKGYDHTGMLSDEEVDNILKTLKNKNER
jgi:hypothetical protein